MQSLTFTSFQRVRMPGTREDSLPTHMKTAFSLPMGHLQARGLLTACPQFVFVLSHGCITLLTPPPAYQRYRELRCLSSCGKIFYSFRYHLLAHGQFRPSVVISGRQLMQRTHKYWPNIATRCVTQVLFSLNWIRGSYSLVGLQIP
jgi:hypothetical protein